MKKILSLVLALLMLLAMLVSCDANAKVPKEARIDESGNIVVTFDDGSTETLGKTSLPSKAEVDESGNIVVSYNDGTTKVLGKVEKQEVKSVKSVTVNDEMHAIVSYDDGTSEDLGYVGVEVEPPMYTVTFVDASGKTLKSETLYRGRSATAPAAPNVTDKIFDKWDTDFTNVQSDLTVKPIYKDKASYTVTFVDSTGKTLKTETVIEGKSATAPNPPAVDGKVFDKWDKSFSSVRSDLTVTALYRDKGTFTVAFKDYSGLVLGTAKVNEGDTAKAPVTPKRDGYTFTGWSASLSNVSKNLTVTAQYKINSGNNIIDIAYEITSSNTVKVTYAVKGTVKFAGCDIEIKIPSGLTYKSMEAGSGVVANKSGNSILINVAGSSNITKEMKLVTVTYTFTGADATFIVNVSEMFDQNMNAVKYSVVGKKITLK